MSHRLFLVIKNLPTVEKTAFKKRESIQTKNSFVLSRIVLG